MKIIISCPDCGREKTVWPSKERQLKTHKCKTCAGRDRAKVMSGNKRLPLGDAAINKALAQYKGSAKSRGLKWELTRKGFIRLTSQPCHYCGECASRVTWSYNRDGTKDQFYNHNGLDRVDNNLGYVKGNVVPCCTTCNLAKRAMSYAEFVDWLRRAYLYITK